MLQKYSEGRAGADWQVALRSLVISRALRWLVSAGGCGDEMRWEMM